MVAARLCESRRRAASKLSSLLTTRAGTEASEDASLPSDQPVVERGSGGLAAPTADADTGVLWPPWAKAGAAVEEEDEDWKRGNAWAKPTATRSAESSGGGGGLVDVLPGFHSERHDLTDCREVGKVAVDSSLEPSSPAVVGREDNATLVPLPGICFAFAGCCF
mmetsp:Transcript_91320/g.261388  ORF Transcript_91320/g.261388 Transcript_91320/m.261388 type:complete len:164 (-) Transcript_91320:539-1030(-)